MHRPRIGIPLCLDDRGRWRQGHTYHYIDGAYSGAIERAGGLVEYLPIQAATDAIDQLVAGIDGLLLPGGDDLAPEPGDPLLPSDLLDLAPERQVRFDRELAEGAIARGIPVLGICYGMQLLARLRGGCLEAHLPSQRPELPPHKFKDPAERHPLRLAAGSRLAGLLGIEATRVNSLHHQAIRELGAAHRAVAWSPDGLIEAFEARGPEMPFEIGVQWHPEKLGDRESERLFAGFIDACRSDGEAGRR